MQVCISDTAKFQKSALAEKRSNVTGRRYGIKALEVESKNEKAVENLARWVKTYPKRWRIKNGKDWERSQ